VNKLPAANVSTSDGYTKRVIHFVVFTKRVQYQWSLYKRRHRARKGSIEIKEEANVTRR